ncbi:hypothetical protein PVAND_016861 [Polypedilum vanderplanki]|uniref:Uncharacterized protein n=1 Tax=Polypedilum vanderplanki TaxID=319348 RepID=A0A9J6BHF6_POLVA|nr:hypothetical protein PVAND_016861 [Polypedilum vanderplanki]
MMPKAMRSRDIVNADPEQCQSGNITGIHPSRVYQKVRSEALAKNDRAINDLDDLTEELKYEQSIGRKFIQKIDLYPFSTILINEDNMKILKNELQSKRVIYINIDATGGILRKVSEAPLLHHTLILPVKANDANRSHVLINLGELITVDSCSFNIEYFLRFYKNKFLNITKENRMAQIFVTDKSFANINAIINSQNNMTLREYLDTTYQICIGNRNIEHLTLAMLCSSHITKNWKDEIKKHFQHLNKEEFFFICSLIGHSMTIEIYDDLANFLKLIIRLFCTPKKNLDYQSILNQIHHTLAMNKDCNMTNEDEQQIDTDDDLSILSSKTIYQSSPFFKFFNDFATQLIDEQFFQDESDDNPFYSTIFVKEFMKKSISLIPLWSASLPKLLLMHETYRRANNGYIEGYFGNLKSSLRSNTTIGKLGSIKIGRYIRFIKEKNKIDFQKRLNLK